MRFSNDKGMIAYSKSSNDYDHSDILEQLEQFADFNISLLNDLMMYLEDNFKRVGFLASIIVDAESRGQGAGRDLMNLFEEEVSKETDMDFLLARIQTPQMNGFNLIEFYQKRGYEPITFSNGEMMMVNKDYASEIRREVFNIYSTPNMNCQSNDFTF